MMCSDVSRRDFGGEGVGLSDCGLREELRIACEASRASTESADESEATASSVWSDGEVDGAMAVG